MDTSSLIQTKVILLCGYFCLCNYTTILPKTCLYKPDIVLVLYNYMIAMSESFYSINKFSIYLDRYLSFAVMKIISFHYNGLIPLHPISLSDDVLHQGISINSIGLFICVLRNYCRFWSGFWWNFRPDTTLDGLWIWSLLPGCYQESTLHLFYT